MSRLILIIICSLLVRTTFAQWTNFRGDNQNTGQSKVKQIANQKLSILSFQTDGLIWGSAIEDDEENIYVGSADKFMYSFTKNLKLRWKYKLLDKADSLIDSAATITSKGLLIIPGGDGFLHAVKKDSGQGVWKFKASGASDDTHSSGVVVNSFEGNVTEGPNGNIYAGNDNGEFYCVSPDGQLLWKIKTGMMIWSMAAFSENNEWMIFGSLDKHIYLVNPATGYIYHKKKIGAEIKASPAIDGKKVFFGDSQGRYHGLEVISTRKGSFKLKRIFLVKVSGEIYSSTALKDGKLVVGSLDGKLYSFDQKGKLLWSYNTYSPISSSPVIDQSDNVYFGNRSGRIYSLNLVSGKRNWSYRTNVSNAKVNLDASPLITKSGRIINGSYSGIVYSVPIGFCDANTQNNKCEFGGIQDLPLFARELSDGTHFIAQDRDGDYHVLNGYRYKYPQVLKLKLVHIKNGVFINRMAINPIGLNVSDKKFEVVVSSDGETINLVPTEKIENGILDITVRGTLYEKSHWFWDRFKYIGLSKFVEKIKIESQGELGESAIESFMDSGKSLYVNSLYVSQPKSLDTYIPAALDGQAFQLAFFEYNKARNTIKAKVKPATKTVDGFSTLNEPSKEFIITGSIDGDIIIFNGMFKIAAMGGTIPFDSARFTIQLNEADDHFTADQGEFFMKAKCLKLKGNGSNYTFSPALIAETCDHKLRVISTGKFNTTIE